MVIYNYDFKYLKRKLKMVVNNFDSMVGIMTKALKRKKEKDNL